MNNNKNEKYKNYEYPEEIKQLLIIFLTPQDKIIIKNLYEKLQNNSNTEPYYYLLQDLYILYIKHKIKTSKLSEIYDINIRTIQNWIKASGLREIYLNQKSDKVKIKKKKKKNSVKKIELEKNINDNSISSLLGMDIRNVNDYPEFLNGFIDYYEVIRGKSKNTIDGYIIDISLFLKFMKVYKGQEKEAQRLEDVKINDITNIFMKNITLTDIYAFLSYAEKVRENGTYTRSRKVSALRALFGYLHQKAKIIDENPTLELETPKKEKRNPIYLTLEQCQILLNSMDKNDEKYARDYCILVLFLNCGMRISELCSIKIKRIKNDTLTIIGKGNKERTVYLNNACLKAIENYLKVRDDSKASLEDKEYLFLSSQYKKINKRTVELMVKKRITQAGLTDANYTPHKLRHTAATLMYKHGNVDIRSLQGILGHESISTTQIYTHVDDETLREAVKSNPLADL